uniref:Large ribosomal subunit protein mL42 n=1 Tax=Xenopsylla cheopis TaxID=163159 RepID=A0A6M2DE24_XENCH
MALRLCFSNSFKNKYLNITTRSITTNGALHFRSVDKIGVTDDQTTFVAWHPKKDFPYECSRPLPEVNEDNGSYLKNLVTKNAFKSPHPEIARQELMRITHTSKHVWFPRARDKRAKKTPMDREYL